MNKPMISAVLLGVSACASVASGQGAEWVWGSAVAADHESVYLWRSIELPVGVESAVVSATCDNIFDLTINGEEVLSGHDWTRLYTADVADVLRPGGNLIAALCRNETGPAAFVLKLDVTLEDGTSMRVVSDGSWRVSGREPEGWPRVNDGGRAAHSFGSVDAPDGPWANPMEEREATPVSSIRVPEGFEVDLLASAQPGEGSWVCLAFGPSGELVISPERGPLLRVRLDGDRAVVSHAGTDLGRAHGLLFAYDALYAIVSDEAERGGGLHRLRDRDGDGLYEEREVLSSFGNASEHGPHGLVLGPDGLIYTVHGNYTPLPDGISPRSSHRDYAEDVLLPRLLDPNGHAVRIRAPGARVLRTDRDGASWELFAAGMRNPYDLAFNRDGELFTYDADMEWDIGAPWYRPVRTLHVVSGGEYGWRTGSGKWAAWYADSLPAAVDMGLGSPTGVVFGYETRFPEPYREALFVADWAYGRIFAVHLRGAGASYVGTDEVFAEGTPLNVTDLAVGPDGAMYFTTGGRGTQSGLYRIRAVDPAGSSLSVPLETGASSARERRRRLEALHVDDDAPLADAWSSLDSADRFVRYAARIAIEHRDPSLWLERGLGERRVQARLEMLLAATRVGGAGARGRVLESLFELPLASLPLEQKLAAVRVLSLQGARHGSFTARERALVLRALDGWYPAGSLELNRDLSMLLCWLEAPGVVERTLALMRTATNSADAMHYAAALRVVVDGWTPEARAEYFGWLRDARTLEGGASLRGFVASIEREALESIEDEATRGAVLAMLESGDESRVVRAEPEIVAASWTVEELIAGLDRVGRGRDFESGRTAFATARCVECHRMAGQGGSAGPDLTGAVGRFSRRDLLTAILEPSRDVSDQYQRERFELSDGTVVDARVLEEDSNRLFVNTDAYGMFRREIRAGSIVGRGVSPESPMPADLINGLSVEQVLDMMAYIESGADARSERFTDD